VPVEFLCHLAGFDHNILMGFQLGMGSELGTEIHKIVPLKKLLNFESRFL
jgi:hypothetical protein